MASLFEVLRSLSLGLRLRNLIDASDAWRAAMFLSACKVMPSSSAARGGAAGRLRVTEIRGKVGSPGWFVRKPRSARRARLPA